MSSAVSRSEFARRIGVTPPYVTKLADQGRLVLTQDGRVLVDESIALIEATKGNRDDVAARHEEKRKAAASAAPAADTVVDQSLHQAKRVKAVSEARIAAAKADQEEMARDKEAGALIAREDVDFVLNDFGATLRGLLENLPDKLAPVVYPLTTLEETRAALDEACEAVLLEMSETMKRRAKEMGA